MNILVCIKQVPNTRHMTIDPETHRLVRHGITAILNPADRGALERALRLRDQHGGTVSVISMGAPQAEEVLQSAWLVGADRCVLLTDPAFGGSDTFATASVLAAAVHSETERSGCPFDVILCGKSTIDGETGQVGPELAELLGIAHFTNITQLHYSGSAFALDYTVDGTECSVIAAPPVLLSYPLGGDAFLRPSVPARLQRPEEIRIPRLGLAELAPWLREDEIGLKGSCTQVIRSFVPPTQRRGIRLDSGTAAEKALRLVEHLKRDGLLGSRSGQAAAEGLSPAAEKGSGRICVFVEQNRDGNCKNISLELLTPALQIGNAAGLRVSAIVLGADNRRAVETLRQYPVEEILSCQDPRFEGMQLHDYTEAAGAMLGQLQPLGLLVGSTDLGKELAARLAARFRTGLVAECSGLRYDSELQRIVWSRPAYGGKLMADIICKDRLPQMGTVREGVFELPAKAPGDPQLLEFSAPEAALASAVTLVRKGPAAGFAPKDSTDVSMMVGMGRGIRDMDGFDLCCDFADAIGADIGASKGATELRLLSARYLIGSNGKTVRPGIYFACGISGSLQHMTGVLDAGCIVAINRDPEADIFRYADYCVVEDMFRFLPELQKQMEAL